MHEFLLYILYIYDTLRSSNVLLLRLIVARCLGAVRSTSACMYTEKDKALQEKIYKIFSAQKSIFLLSLNGINFNYDWGFNPVRILGRNLWKALIYHYAYKILFLVRFKVLKGFEFFANVKHAKIVQIISNSEIIYENFNYVSTESFNEWVQSRKKIIPEHKRLRFLQVYSIKIVLTFQ